MEGNGGDGMNKTILRGRIMERFFSLSLYSPFSPKYG